MEAPVETKPQRSLWPFWLAFALVPTTLTVAVAVGVAIVVMMQRPSGKAASTVSVVISGDTGGWIVPCGCTTNQSGGLLRRGTFIEQQNRWLRVGVTADAGTGALVADAGGAPGGTSPYHQVKFEAILRGELAMGLVAHNLGGPEAALGASYLRRVARELEVPFVSANLRDDKGELVAEPIRMVTQQGRRVGFIGVLARRYARDGLQVDDPAEAVLRTAAKARGRYDTLIVLAYLPEDELRQLAAALPEVDAVIGGPTGQSIQPQAIGPTLVGSATNKGKFLILLETDESEPRRPWKGKVVEMNGNYADDSAQEDNVRRYLAELAKHDFPAELSGFVPALPTGLPAGYRIAGNAACVQCHKDDCKSLEPSKHFHAWESIQEKGFHVDSYCQQCHTTGYGQPAGFVSANRTSALRSVGCESCHGPSQAHVQNPRVRTPFAARDQCISCHDRENSPKFAYNDYWQRILHGKPAAR